MSSFGTTLSRYIFRQTLGATLLILLSLTAITWIAVALRQLDILTSEGRDALVFFKMTLLALPSLMAMIVPVALLIASMHVLNRLNTDSELIVMTAGGAPVWATLRPLLLLAAFVSIAISLVNHIAGPWTQQRLAEYAMQARSDLIAQVIQPGRFTTPEANLTIHIRDRSMAGELLGLLIHDGRDASQVASYMAEQGQIIKQNGGAFLLMERGHIVRRTDAKGPPHIVVFDRYAVDLQRFQQPVTPGAWRGARERSTSELWSPNLEEPVYKANPGRFRSELHERISSPLYPFGFVFLAVGFVGQTQTNRQIRLNSLVWAFVLAMGGRLLGIGAARLTVASAEPAVLLYAIPLSAVALGGLVAWRKMLPRRPSTLSKWIEQAMERAVATLVEPWRAGSALPAAQRERG